MPKNPTPPIPVAGADDFFVRPSEPAPTFEPEVPVAGELAPAKLEPNVTLAAEPVDAGRKTPAEWAEVLGHTDRPAAIADGDGELANRGPGKGLAIRPIRQARGYIFAAVKQHAGWGRQHAEDVRLTREEYESAVAEALGTPLAPPAERKPAKGQPETPPEGLPRRLAWRHDVVTKANEAAKAGGES